MKILIVSPYFPPYSGVGVIRISSLVRYMLELGYDITVLQNRFDKSNNSPENSEDFSNKIKTHEVDIVEKGKPIENFRRCEKKYREAFNEIMGRHKFDCVLITAGPFYTLPLCKLSKKYYHTPCIIDFRDLWIFDIRSIKKFLRPRSIIGKMFFYPVEKTAIKYADKIITVTDGWCNILRRVYPKYKQKIDVIYNGYDDSYLNQKVIKENNVFLNNEVYRDTYKIVSFGKLSYYSKEYSLTFFEAIKKIESQYPTIKIFQIGLPEKQTEDVLDKTAFDKGKFINTGFCDYREGIANLLLADICILVDIRKQSIGTKIYDYIYANKPVIYIGKQKTFLSNFVSSLKNGFSCQTETQVIDAINYIIDNRIDHLTERNEYKLYSRSRQNQNYVKLLDDLLNKGD
ncbi:glycosyltransferase [Marinilactibacillus psychrotolerans]|uniref:glycosyltransferase n=1 Tax=Marinilactibacillus psychrotolerans TaxID=191770 RepID=UPI00388B8874